MDIWPNTASQPVRASITDTLVPDPVNGLLRSLLRAGTIEAEVVQRLPAELLLNTRLGPLRVPRGIELEVGERIRIRVDQTGPAPVLRVERQQPQPLRIPFAEQPQLARAVSEAPVVLAELITLGRGESQLRVADRIVRVARELPVSRDRLLLLQADRRAAVVEISPVIRRDILLSLLRFMLPQQVDRGTTDLVRLFDWALRSAQAAQQSPPRIPTAASSDERNPAGTTRPSTAAATPATARVTAGPATRAAAAATAAPAVSDMTTRAVPVAERSAVTAVSPRESSPARPRSTAATDTRAPQRQPIDASRVTGLSQHPAVLRSDPQPPLPRIQSVRPISTESGPRSTESPSSAAVSRLESTGARPTLRPPGGRVLSTSSLPLVTRGMIDSARPADSSTAPAGANRFAAPTPAVETTAVSRPPDKPPATAVSTQPLQWNSSRPVTWPEAGPGFETLPSLASLHAMLRGPGQFEAADLVHWMQLLGLARLPAQPADNRLPNDLGGLIYRALKPLVDMSRIAAPTSGREAIANNDGAQAEHRLPAWLREGLRLVEQALGQTLLQRVATGLQSEAQQPLSLNLTLPFVDEQQVRPLAIDIEQHGGRDEAAEPRWDIRLDFELAGLGPLSCLASLRAARVGASFYSRSETIQAQIAAALPELRRQLDRVGLVADELHSHVGEPPSRPERKPRVPVESVIDLKA